MKKLVRTLMLAAAMLLPFASHAQTLTVYDGTDNSQYVPFDGYNADAAQHNQMLYPATDLAAMNGQAILQMVFYIDQSATNGSNTSESRLGTWTVSLGETTATSLSDLDNTTTLTQVYQGYFDCSTGTLTLEFDVPYLYNGGNLLVDLNHSAASWNRWYFVGTTTTSDMSYNSYQSDSYTFLPKCSFTYGAAPTCFKVTNLAISATSASSITLTWADAMNTGATYTVSDADGVIASNITGTTYTVTGLNANTEYTFSVVANCSATDASAAETVTGRTACVANTVFPWSENFESYSSGELAIPCWQNEHISGSGSQVFKIYTSSNGGNTTHQLQLPDMSNGTMTKLMLPLMDIPTGSIYQFSVDIYRNASGSSYTSEGVRVYASTDGNIEGATELGFLYRNYTQTDGNVVTAETATGWYTYDFIIPFSGEVYIILRGENQYGSSTYLDNFVIDEAPSCVAVSGLTTSNITSSSITLTWTDALNAGATYTVYAMTATDTIVEEDINDTTYTLTGLNADMEYTFGVVANCSASDASSMATVSGRTACANETLPYSENFDSWTSKSPCWSFLSGAYNMGTGTPTAYTSAWTLNSTYGSYITISGKALTMNVYSTTRYWAVSPLIDVTSDNILLSFDVAVAAWSNVTPNYDADDTLAVAISTDGGTTFTNLAVYGSEQLNNMTSAYTTILLPISGYADSTVRIAFFAGSSASGGDNRIVIDNISLTESTGEICYPTTGLTVSNITATSATVTWNSSTVGNYVLYIMNDSSSYMYTDTVADLYTLQPNTEYTVGVTVDCPSGESPMITTTFRTACANETLPYSENFDSWTSKSPCWSFLSGAYNMGAGPASSTTLGWSLNNTYGSNITINGKALTMNVYSTNRYWAVTPLIDVTSDNIMLSVDVAVSAWSDATPAFDTDDTLAFAVSTDGGATFTHVAAYGNTDLNALTGTPTTLNVPISGYNNQTIRIAIFAGSAASGGDNRISIDSISVTELVGDFCAPVTGLTVDSADAESISLSWTSDGSNFTVVNMADGTVAATTTDTYVTISGLTASTAYTFGVVNDCGSSTSDTIQISASTTCLNACTLTIAVSDAYGDGWGDYSASYLNVIQGGSTIFSYTMPSQDLMNTMIYDTLQVSVCGGEPLSLSWTSGGEWAYDEEASFTLIDPAGVSFYILNDASTLPSDSVFFTDSDPCGIHTAAVGDSVKFTFAVNDATMGTTTPAPGEYYYFVGDALSLVATANPGYHLATWTLDITDPTGATNSQTVAASSNSFFDDEWDETVVANYFIGYEVSVTATFAADSLMGDTTAFTLEMAVNDAAMGYTTPAVGTYTFSSDTTLNLSATANPGYEFTGWHWDIYESGVVVSSQDIPSYQDTLYLNVTSLLFGQTYALTAQFAEINDNDSLVIVTAVNNASMGTINPAPGTHVYHAGDYFMVEAIPNEGYHVESWHYTWTYEGEVIYDTTLNLGITQIFPYDTAEYYLGWTMSYTVNFAEGSTPEFNDSLFTLVTAVNDATMGTITPAPGTHTYDVGETYNVTATANEGYYLYAYQVNMYVPTLGEILNETIVLDELAADEQAELQEILNYTVEEEMLGAAISITAVFARLGGINDVEADNFTVSATEGTVVVLGAEGQQVTLFDVNGRMMSRKDNAAERVEFRVSNSGVYLVKVGNAAAKRVVVIR